MWLSGLYKTRSSQRRSKDSETDIWYHFLDWRIFWLLFRYGCIWLWDFSPSSEKYPSPCPFVPYCHDCCKWYVVRTKVHAYDPFCALYEFDLDQKKYIEVARTQTFNDVLKYIASELQKPLKSDEHGIIIYTDYSGNDVIKAPQIGGRLNHFRRI